MKRAKEDIDKDIKDIKTWLEEAYRKKDYKRADVIYDKFIKLLNERSLHYEC